MFTYQTPTRHALLAVKLEYLAVYGHALIEPPTHFFVTDRNVTTLVVPHSVQEARLKTQLNLWSETCNLFIFLTIK